MAGLVGNLIDVLKGQVELYGEIIALSGDKKEFIIKNDIEGLRTIVSQENALVPRALRHDKDMASIIANICIVLNKEEADMNLTYLVSLMENQPQYGELKTVVDEVLAAARELKAVNDSTKVLVESALDFIDYSMNAVQSSFNAIPVGYGETLSETREVKNFLDKNG